MNRWIVPMDRDVDYLSLHTGHTFQVPFDVMVVFSSNFVPQRLSDGAFLRRLGYKIEVPERRAERIRRACSARRAPALACAFDAARLRLPAGVPPRGAAPLLACYPRDLMRQLRDLARYEGTRARTLAPHAGLGLGQLFCRGRPGRRRATPCKSAANAARRSQRNEHA